LRGLFPTIFGGWGLIVGGIFLGFPTDWGAGFRGYWALVSTAGAARASLRDAYRQAQDEAFPRLVRERLILSLSKDEARDAGSVGVVALGIGYSQFFQR